MVHNKRPLFSPSKEAQDLETYDGPEAVQEWKKLLDSIKSALHTCYGSATSIPPRRFGTKLLRPFLEIIDSLGLKDHFIRKWIDLLSFLLVGVKSNGILSAEMVYKFAEWYKPGCCLEYPLHVTGAVVDALIRGMQKFGGRIFLKCHVENIVVENGKAKRVKLRSGQAVVSNAPMWDTLSLLPKEVIPKSYEDTIKATPQGKSFMHLHLGFDSEGIPEDLAIQFITYVLSPDLAPPGEHVLHAYLPGTEPFGIWEGLDRKSAEYNQLKDERSEVLWKAAERSLGPGIGVPAVAASGAIVANSLVSVSQHSQLLDAVGSKTFANALMGWINVKDVANAHILAFKLKVGSRHFALKRRRVNLEIESSLLIVYYLNAWLFLVVEKSKYLSSIYDIEEACGGSSVEQVQGHPSPPPTLTLFLHGFRCIKCNYYAFNEVDGSYVLLQGEQQSPMLLPTTLTLWLGIIDTSSAKYL
ncbi:hypothetical protein LguiB_036376 [Lonicera macranthoides]